MSKALFIGGDQWGYHPLNNVSDLFKKWAKELGIDLIFSEDRKFFSLERIKNFSFVICYTTGYNLTKRQAEALREAIIGNPWGKIKRPVNFIGIHGATASFLNQEWYFRMLGGKFLVHPKPFRFKVEVEDRTHPYTYNVNDFEIEDELYIMDLYPPFKSLLKTNYKGFILPLAWTKLYGRGKVFYISLGHSRESFLVPEVGKILCNVMKDFTSDMD